MTTPCRIWDGCDMHYLNDVLFETDGFAGVWLEDAVVLINQFNPKDKRLYQPTSPWQLMKFIGLSDRHGTGIYEGDIVEADGNRFVIGYNRDQCRYCMYLTHSIGLPPAIVLDRSLAETLTVLGSRLETPDLLQGSYSLAA